MAKEILNPGTLPYCMTVPQLSQLHSSMPANPVLAHPLYLAGYIDRMGTGTTDIIEQCEAMGLPTPTFRQDSFFQVTLYRKALDKELSQSNLDEVKTTKETTAIELNTKQRLVIKYCRLPRTSRQILKHIGVSYHSANIKKYVNDLIDAKLLKVVNGDSRNNKDVMYVRL